MLSSPDIIEILNRDYVNSWVLFQDLVKILGIKVNAEPGMSYLSAVKEAAAKLTGTGTDFQRLVAGILARYNYPVDTHVYGRDGSFVGNTYAGAIFDDPYIGQKFMDLLKSGAKK